MLRLGHLVLDLEVRVLKYFEGLNMCGLRGVRSLF
jgi:hypothetical protein